MKKVGPAQLILLLGNRIQPATMLAYHLRPARVACIGSTDRPDTVSEVQDALTYLLGAGRLAGGRTVAPYRLDETLAAIEALAADHAGASLIIGLTGCPLPMSIAGYEAGRRLGCPVLYVDTAGARIMDFTRPEQVEPLRVRFAIKDYLAICGLQLVTGRRPRYFSTPAERTEAARLLGRAGLAGVEVIAALRRAGLLAGRRRRLPPGTLSREGRHLLQQLAALHVLSEVSEDFNGFIRIRVPTVGEQAFLNGDWLEEYVWDAAETLRAEHPPLFDATDLRMAFQARGGRDKTNLNSQSKLREIDFIGLHGGVPLIATCKSGATPWQKQDLDEVAAIAQLLGGAYVTRLFISNQYPPTSPDAQIQGAYAQFQEQARRQRVVIVSGEQLGRLPEILRKEITDPTYKPL